MVPPHDSITDDAVSTSGKCSLITGMESLLNDNAVGIGMNSPDRLGMLDPRSGEFIPIPTALSFSSDSIPVISEHFPDVDTASSVIESCGGTMVHVAPPRESVERAADTAKAQWIVFPEWSATETSQLERATESEAFFRLAGSAYNYEMLGAEGFAAVAELVATCRSYRLVCSALEDALTVLGELTDGN